MKQVKQILYYISYVESGKKQTNKLIKMQRKDYVGARGGELGRVGEMGEVGRRLKKD